MLESILPYTTTSGGLAQGRLEDKISKQFRINFRQISDYCQTDFAPMSNQFHTIIIIIGSTEQWIEETFVQIMEATSMMDQRSFQEFADQFDKFDKLAMAEMAEATQLSPPMKACRASHPPTNHRENTDETHFAHQRFSSSSALCQGLVSVRVVRDNC